jgi:DNA-binding phage protein
MKGYSVFDAADFLDSEEIMAGFLEAAAEDPNPKVLEYAVEAVARARRRLASEWALAASAG